MKKQRINWIDCSKGILICLVVLGHLISNNNISVQNWIYSFHIPAFFILEGITLCVSDAINTSFLKTIYNNIRSLIYPYIIFSNVFLLRSIIFLGIGSITVNQICNYFLLSISFWGVGILWFLPTLFFAKLLFTYIVKKKLRIYTYILSLVIVVIQSSRLDIFVEADVFSTKLLLILFIRTIIATGFICVGYFVFTISHKKVIIPQKIKQCVCLVALVISIILYRINGTVDLHVVLIGNPIIYFIVAILGSFGIYGVSTFLSNSKVLLFFGKNSMIIMLTHTIFFLYRIALMVSKMVIENYIIQISLGFIIVMIMECFVIVVINSKLKWLISPQFFKERECKE